MFIVFMASSYSYISMADNLVQAINESSQQLTFQGIGQNQPVFSRLFLRLLCSFWGSHIAHIPQSLIVPLPLGGRAVSSSTGVCFSARLCPHHIRTTEQKLQ